MLTTLLLTEPERVVLDKALELFINLGLGNLDKIEQRLKTLNPNITVKRDGEEIKIEDGSSHVICAFAIQAKLGDNNGAWEWASRTLHEKRETDPIV
jgi:hypothetical protein